METLHPFRVTLCQSDHHLFSLTKEAQLSSALLPLYPLLRTYIYPKPISLVSPSSAEYWLCEYYSTSFAHGQWWIYQSPWTTLRYYKVEADKEDAFVVSRRRWSPTWCQWGTTRTRMLFCHYRSRPSRGEREITVSWYWSILSWVFSLWIFFFLLLLL